MSYQEFLNAKQNKFLAHTNTGEILTACSQPVAKCKQPPNQQGKSKTLQSLLCTLPTVISRLSCGSSCGQLSFSGCQLQRSKFGGRCYFESEVEELRWYLSEYFMTNTFTVSSGINPILLCMSPQHLPLQTNPLP